MINLKSLLDMVATEALEGGSRDHYFDEFRNPGYHAPKIYPLKKTETNLQPIKFDLELIKKQDNTYEWVE